MHNKRLLPMLRQLIPTPEFVSLWILNNFSSSTSINSAKIYDRNLHIFNSKPPSQPHRHQVQVSVAQLYAFQSA